MVVVWRKDRLKIQFDNLDGGWFATGEELQQSSLKLVELITWKLESTDRLSYAIELPQEFIDEHAKVSCLSLVCDFVYLNARIGIYSSEIQLPSASSSSLTF